MHCKNSRCLIVDNIYVIFPIMKNYTKFKDKLLKNERIKRAYDELGPEFQIAALIIKMRLQKKITQRELAKQIGTKQSAISRFESGTYNPSVDFLYRIVEALDARIQMSIRPR